MRQISEGELLSLTSLLTMEKDGLAVAKVMKNLISDEDLKKQAETGVLAMEGRIKGVQQFINENQVTITGGAK
ncbi:hypothetical protein KPL47_12755 [Clostridium estertheticum]|uniref:hypothetical protein n=1 Tax=Clostridium estertheticum TaxID=238834 RepID=UPI001C0B3F85|nr:hypothetical protein [Clostridium estertheticum]MBU3177219.1 hypothetical protein [Clostridium estertheticum]